MFSGNLRQLDIYLLDLRILTKNIFQIEDLGTVFFASAPAGAMAGGIMFFGCRRHRMSVRSILVIPISQERLEGISSNLDSRIIKIWSL